MSNETTSIASAAEEYVFTEEEHTSVLLRNLNSLRKNEKFCDVTLRVGVKQFSVHKCVLAASSLYFQKMFESDLLEARMNVVHMKEIEQEIMKSLLDYVYTGVVKINESNWKNLFKAAHLLDIRPVVNAVSHFLEKNLNVDNCLAIMLIAESYDCQVLKEKAFSYALKNFSKVMETEEFLRLSEDNLIELTSSNELHIENETSLFLGAKEWFDFDPEHRSEQLHKVMETVRLPLLESNFLCDGPELFPAFKNNAKCMQQLHEAMSFHISPTTSKAMFTKQTQPRRDPNSIPVVVTFGGYHTYDMKGLRSFECFCPNSKKSYLSSWADLPFTVGRHQVVQYQESVYLAGGYQNATNTPTNKVWRYNQVLNSWHEVAPMLECRRDFGLVLLDGYIYALGGVNEGQSKLVSVERYNPNTNSWSLVQNLPQAVLNITAVAHDKFIYVFGRMDPDHHEVYRYDPRTDGWVEITNSLSVTMSNHFGYAFDKYIYLISSSNGMNVDRFDTTNHQWKRMTSTSETRKRAGSALINGKIYILSVFNQNGFVAGIGCYDIENNRFEIVGKLLKRRNRFCCLALHMKKSDLLSKGTKYEEYIAQTNNIPNFQLINMFRQ